MGLNIQNFLRNNPIKMLEEKPYCLKVKQHPEYANLHQFCYDQLESPKNDPICIEARGIILDSYDNWNIVAYPFNRFFNYGEGYAANIDWATARVQEKVDGSLIILYYYGMSWNVATKGSPTASGPLNDGTSTFKELFWKCFKEQGLDLKDFNTEFTYMFEMVSLLNRVVCRYKDDIILLGVRDNKTLKEIPVEIFRFNTEIDIVKSFPLQTIEDVVDAAAKLDPMIREGFVVVDSNFNRIKIKSPAYVAIHHLRDGSPTIRMLELIIAGEESEVMSYKILDEFPEEKAMYDKMQESISKIVLQTESEYDIIKNMQNQKDFAIEAVKSKVSGALFGLRNGKVKSIKAFLLGMNTSKLLELMKNYDN